MELVVETSLQLLCPHGFNHRHGLFDGSICYPPQSVESHLIDTDGSDDDLLEWLGDAFHQLEDGEADLIQIMARRL